MVEIWSKICRTIPDNFLWIQPNSDHFNEFLTKFRPSTFGQAHRCSDGEIDLTIQQISTVEIHGGAWATAARCDFEPVLRLAPHGVADTIQQHRDCHIIRVCLLPSDDSAKSLRWGRHRPRRTHRRLPETILCCLLHVHWALPYFSQRCSARNLRIAHFRSPPHLPVSSQRPTCRHRSTPRRILAAAPQWRHAWVHCGSSDARSTGSMHCTCDVMREVGSWGQVPYCTTQAFRASNVFMSPKGVIPYESNMLHRSWLWK